MTYIHRHATANASSCPTPSTCVCGVLHRVVVVVVNVQTPTFSREFSKGQIHQQTCGATAPSSAPLGMFGYSVCSEVRRLLSHFRSTQLESRGEMRGGNRLTPTAIARSLHTAASGEMLNATHANSAIPVMQTTICETIGTVVVDVVGGRT